MSSAHPLAISKAEFPTTTSTAKTEATHPAYTFPIRSAKNAICAAACRVRAEDLCEAADVDPSQLTDDSARISLKQLLQLYECAARLTKDNFFGLHVGSQNHPTKLGAYGYMIMHSRTLGEALDRAARYTCLWTEGVACRLEIERSTARFTWEYKDQPITESRQACEMMTLSPARFSQLITGGHGKVREARFQHPRPKDISEHRRLFGAPAYFRFPTNELIFDKAALSLPVRSADPELGDVLAQHAEHLLTRASPRETLIDRAESALYNAIRQSHVALDAVCHSLGMSTRSLQRALKNEGVSYRGLLVSVRRELAEQYLQDPTKKISEIAYLLAYAHPSEFDRAFRLWTGMAPKRYRHRMAKAGSPFPEN